MKSAVKLSSITRRFPKSVDLIRRILPLSLKRKIGAALLPDEKGGEVIANDGRKFVMIPDRLFLQVVYDGVFEPSLTNFMSSIIQPDDTAVDVGSNFGWFATHMANQCQHVVCFEPAKRIRGILEENVTLNNFKNVSVRPFAIGSQPGEVSFVVEGDAARESALGYVSSEPVVDQQNAEIVKVVRLDDELEAFENKISLMKVDCEGFEHEAFKGSSKIFLWEHPPVIITEANRETLERSGSTREQMCNELTQHGYVLYGMKSDGKIYPDDGKAPALACLPPRGQFSKRLTAPA